MSPIAKQDRSRKRIEAILATAEKILINSGVKEITIANISELSGLKRTSTYKFFPTPDDIKIALISKYVNECCNVFSDKSKLVKTDQLSIVILKCVEILFDYFKEFRGAELIILNNTVTPPINSKSIASLAYEVQIFIESNIELPGMYNKDGIYRVLTQIILSIFSLSTKENGELNETGKIEAHRAGFAYMQNWVKQSS
jgi:AcrR family transcriptional regulator